jgi:hypothetical protein
MHHYHLRWDEIGDLPYGLVERLIAGLPRRT